jgi:hypothetical protein
MRGTLYKDGFLNRGNDNPDGILNSFFEIYVDDRSRESLTEMEKAFRKMMFLNGYTIQEIEKKICLITTPAQESCEIMPGKWEIDGFTFSIRRKDDPLNLTVSDINGCCMRFGSTAESSLVDAISNPSSAIMVIGTDSTLVAHTWLRKGKSGILYLDNVETSKEFINSAKLANAIVSWARIVVGDLSNCVRIGKRYTYLPIQEESIEFGNDEAHVEFGGSEAYTDLVEGVWQVTCPGVGL